MVKVTGMNSRSERVDRELYRRLTQLARDLSRYSTSASASGTSS